ncbi:MAG: DEAD/DEAH box helicase, partial [Anaerolineales bacterium]
MSLDSVVRQWQSDGEVFPNFSVWNTIKPRPAQTVPLPADLHPRLKAALQVDGIRTLYAHQAEAWNLVRSGKNLVLATGTASGKTLAYNLPVLQTLLEDEQARALYLFPTKALAQDQLSILAKQLSAPGHGGEPASPQAAIYDGDTPAGQRAAIRHAARLVLSNPDMLHTGILPHHTSWGDFFQRLRYVVIDEMHSYRGVFGSHVANVLRRLMRVARFHGSRPQFILSSATIGNPAELAQRLIESPVELVDSDGSARGPRYFFLYNPPVIDPALGLRKSSLLEGVRLSQDLLAGHVQTLVFARSRRSVEQILTYMQDAVPSRTQYATSARDAAVPV